MIVTTEHIFLSLFGGDRIKINRMSASILWAVKYGDYGPAMALSSDQSFLIAGTSYFSSNIHLGKLSPSDGSVLASYSSSQDD